MKTGMVIVALLLVAIGYLVVSKVFPIISGYAAKIVCSGVFVAKRQADDVIQNELNTFPLRLATCTVNDDSSVTASVFGLAKKKAVYRKGLGGTLINEITEDELRAQKFNITTPPIINQDSIDWPLGDRLKANQPSNIDQKQLDAAIQAAFTDTGKLKQGTRALVVVHRGEIVAERYAAGFSAHSKLAGWSMAKSVTNALVGILVKQNKLDVHARAPIDEWKNDDRSKITTADIMRMSSGLSWWEYYAAPSDATNMLYNEKSMGRFALRKKPKYEPGKVFNYSSGSTNILSYIIRKTVGDNGYYRFPYEQLFYKLGMLNTVLEVDAGGTFASSSYCFATARDWARFGLLYLNDGVWNGERILPEGWVKFTTTPAEAKLKPEDGRYGAQWWLNAGYGPGNAGRKYPHVPEDCFRCQGYEGQYIWVIPSEDLVIVRLALEKGDFFEPDVFLPAVIKALRK